MVVLELLQVILSVCTKFHGKQLLRLKTANVNLVLLIEEKSEN